MNYLAATVYSNVRFNSMEIASVLKAVRKHFLKRSTSISKSVVMDNMQLPIIMDFLQESIQEEVFRQIDTF